MLTKDGWLQVLDCNVVDQLDTESRQWKEAVVEGKAKAGLIKAGNEKARILTQINDIEKVGKASKS